MPVDKGEAPTTSRAAVCGKPTGWFKLIDRRAFLLSAGVLLAAPLRSEAQQAGPKVPRVGVMWLGQPPSPPLPLSSPLLQFRERLRDLGYVEGQSIEMESRFGAGQALFTQAVDLIQLRVDLIVAMSTAAAWAAKSSTTAVPVVFAIAGNPIQSGLIKSFAQPGGNLTGIYALTGEHSAKRLGLLHEAAPRVTHIGMLWNPSDRLSATELREAQAGARGLNVVLVPLDVRTAGDIETAFRNAKKAGVAALSVLTSPTIVANLRRVADLSLANRLPAIAAYPSFAEFGGLMGYGASNSDMLRRTAACVDKILKGAKPADIPVEQVTKFDFVINMKTAKALGLTIPPSLPLRADQVIQ